MFACLKKVLDERGRTHMINNIAEHLQQCTDRDIVRRAILIFANVDEDFGRRLAQKLNIDLPKTVKKDLHLAIQFLSYLCFFCSRFQMKHQRFDRNIRLNIDFS